MFQSPGQGDAKIIRLYTHCAGGVLHAGYSRQCRQAREQTFIRRGTVNLQQDSPRRGQPSVQAAHRIVGDNPAVIDDDDAIAQAFGFFHIVSGVEQRLAAAFQLLEILEDGIARLGVNADGGLVEQNQLRIVQQRAGNIQPAFHAAAEPLDPIVAAVFQPHERQRILGSMCKLLARQAVEAAEQLEIRPGRQLVVERQFLGHQPHASLQVIRVLMHGLPPKRHGTFIGSRESAHDGQRGGLAGPIRPQQAEGFTGTYLERHVIDGDPVAETFLEVSDGEQVIPSGGHPAVANTLYNETL